MAEGGGEEILNPFDNEVDPDDAGENINMPTLDRPTLAPFGNKDDVRDTSTSHPIAESSLIVHNKWHDTSYNPEDADYLDRGEAFNRIRKEYPEFAKDNPSIQARIFDGKIQVAKDKDSPWNNFYTKKGTVDKRLSRDILDNLGPRIDELVIEGKDNLSKRDEHRREIEDKLDS